MEENIKVIFEHIETYGQLLGKDRNTPIMTNFAPSFELHEAVSKINEEVSGTFDDFLRLIKLLPNRNDTGFNNIMSSLITVWDSLPHEERAKVHDHFTTPGASLRDFNIAKPTHAGVQA